MSKCFVIAWIGCLATVCCSGDTLTLNYQEVVYIDSHDAFQLGVRYDGQCSNLSVEFYPEDEILDGLLRMHKSFLVPASERSIMIRAEDFASQLELFFRVVAMESNRICSNSLSLQTYYRFLTTNLPVRQTVSGDFSLPIPTTDQCEHPTLVIPNPSDHSDHCYCPTVQGGALYSFSECIEFCTGDDSIRLVGDSVAFNSIRTVTDDMTVHFICDVEPCENRQSCVLKTVLTTHQLDLIDAISVTTPNTDFTPPTTELPSSPRFNSMETIILASIGGATLLMVIVTLTLMVLVILSPWLKKTKCCRQHPAVTKDYALK